MTTVVDSGLALDAPGTGTVARFLGPGDPHHFDRAAPYTLRTGQLLRLMTRQLFAYPTAAGQPVADVATSLPTVDNGGVGPGGRELRVVLRDGVYWDAQGARPMVAADFVRGLKRIAHPMAAPVRRYFASAIEGMAGYLAAYDAALGSWDPNAPDFAQFQAGTPIEGVTAESERVLRLRLLAPADEVLPLLATGYAAAAPREYDYYVPDSPELHRNAPSAGPYRISRQLSRDGAIVLERNPRWDPATDAVRRQPVDRVRLAAGTAEPDPAWLFGVTAPGTAGIATDHVVYLTVEHPDPAVRQAVAWAVDRVAVAQATGATVPPDRGDPDTARRLLADAGHGGGLRLPLTTPGGDTHSPLHAALAAGLARAGITLTPAPGPPPAPQDGPGAGLTLREWTPLWPGQRPDLGRDALPLAATPCRSCRTDAVAGGVARWTGAVS